MMAEKTTIGVIMADLYKAFDSKSEIDPDRVALYVRRLSDIPDDILIKAVDDIIDTGQYFPRVAEIRKAAQAVQTNSGYRLHGPDNVLSTGDQLCAQFIALHDAGETNKLAWDALAESFRRLGCEYRAEYCETTRRRIEAAA